MKQDLTTVKGRLKAFCKHLGISEGTFEENAGISKGYVSSIRKGIGDKVLPLILDKYPMLNRDWLLFGEGEMTTNSVNIAQEATMPYNLNTDCEREVEDLKRENEFLKSQLESEKEKNALKDQLIEMLKSRDESSKRKIKKNATNIS